MPSAVKNAKPMHIILPGLTEKANEFKNGETFFENNLAGIRFLYKSIILKNQS